MTVPTQFRPALVSSALLLSAFAAAPLAHANPQDYLNPNMIELVGAQAGIAGTAVGTTAFRIRVSVRTLAGRIEYRDFIIGSDGLVQWSQQQAFSGSPITARLLTIGSTEALWRRGHVGLAFEGVTIGDDLDQGYTNLMRTGVAAIFNMLATANLRVDFRSGYRYESMDFNLSEHTQNHLLPQTFLMRWSRPHGSGNIRATVALPTDEILSPDQYRFNAGFDTQAKWLTGPDMQMAAGLDFSYDRNPFNEVYGLARDNLTAIVHFDISWLGRIGE